jgi:hypothetical protein
VAEWRLLQVEELESSLVDTVHQLEGRIDTLRRKLAAAGASGGASDDDPIIPTIQPNRLIRNGSIGHDEGAAAAAAAVLSRVRVELGEERRRVAQLEAAIEEAAAAQREREREGEEASLRKRLAQLSLLYAEAEEERELLAHRLKQGGVG